jgi:hypothetical protein
MNVTAGRNLKLSAKVCALASALAFLSVHATAQPPPSDLELRAAYCLGATKYILSKSLSELEADPECKQLPSVPAYAPLCRKSQLLNQASEQRTIQYLQRLETYLTTKGFGSSPMVTGADLLAINRGKVDLAREDALSHTPSWLSCSGACFALPQLSEQEMKECVNRCNTSDSNDTFARIEHCAEVMKELPF